MAFSEIEPHYDVALLKAAVEEVFIAIAMPKLSCEQEVWLPRAARPEAGRSVSGRGLTREQAMASCLGEAAELASSCFTGREDMLHAPWRDVARIALHPSSLVLASKAQLRGRCRWNATHGPIDWLPLGFDEAQAADWIVATSPDGADRALVAAACVYIGYFESEDERAFAVADSNGCAAGATLDEAIVSGFLELVERDAAALWWYNCHCRPAFRAAELEGGASLLASLAARRRPFWLLDLTTDLGIPVCVAVSCDPDGGAVAIGSAARFDAGQAVLAALTEMLQMELSIGLRKRLAPLDDRDAFGFWLRHVSLGTSAHLVPSGTSPMPALRNRPAGVADCLEICARAGLRMLVVDLTRAPIGVPVARVIVPGLRPSKRRLAPGRLFDVPARLHWRTRRGSAKGMNPVPLVA